MPDYYLLLDDEFQQWIEERVLESRETIATSTGNFALTQQEILDNPALFQQMLKLQQAHLKGQGRSKAVAEGSNNKGGRSSKQAGGSSASSGKAGATAPTKGAASAAKTGAENSNNSATTDESTDE